jgi:hypothetical protein
MRLTWKDGLATVFVGSAVAVYGIWMAASEVLGLTTTRAVSAVVLILGIAGCYAARSYFGAIYGAEGETRTSVPYLVLVSAFGIVALVGAVVALIGGSTAALTTLIAAMVILWAMATVHHLTMGRAHDLAAVR